MSNPYLKLFDDDEKRLSSDNPYTPLFESDQGRVKPLIRGVTAKDAKSAAKTFGLSTHYGLPLEIVERNLPEIDQARKQQRMEALVEEYPTIGAVLLSDPGMVSILQNDLGIVGPLTEHNIFKGAPSADTVKLTKDYGFKQAQAELGIAKEMYQQQVLDYLAAQPPGSLQSDDPLDAAMKGLKAAGVTGEQAAFFLDKALTKFGSLFIPDPAGGTKAEVLLGNQQAAESLRQATELYLAQPSDKRTEIAGAIFGDAYRKGQALTGVDQAVKYLLSNPMSVVNYTVEMMVAAAPGAAGGAGALTKVGGSLLWESMKAETRKRLITTLGIAGATGGGAFTGSLGPEFSNRLQQNGGNVDEAMNYAITKASADAAVNTAVALIPIPPGSTILTRAAEKVALTGQQAAAGVAGAAAGAAAVGEELSPEEAFLEAALETPSVVTDIPIGEFVARHNAAYEAAQKAQQDVRRAQKAEAFVQGVQDVASQLAGTEASTMGPEGQEALLRVLQEASPEGEVLIDAKTLSQSADLPGLMQLSPAIAEQYVNAAARGGDVSIPIAEFMAKIAPTPYFQQLLPGLRESETAMTLSEAQVFKQQQVEELRKAADEILAKRAEDQPFQESSKKVFDNLVAQMNAANRFTEEANRASVAPLHSVIATLADRLKQTPEQVFQRFQAAIGATPTTELTFDQSRPVATIEDFSPEKIGDIHTKSGWFILTAENPQGRRATPEENATRQAALKAELEARGYLTPDTEGKYTDLDNPADAPLEAGFLVFGMPVEEAQGLSKQFEQDSILAPYGLLYQDNTVTPSRGTNVFGADQPPPDNYYTRVPSTGATFSIDLDFDQRVPLEQVYFQSVSTRTPSQKAGRPDPHMVYDLGVELSAAPEGYQTKLAERVSSYGHWRAPEGATQAELLEAFITHLQGNLVWLYKQVPKRIRERSKLWYVGARRMVDDWAPRYGFTDAQVAAVLAVFSPQKDWNENVSLAERFLDIWTKHQDTPWSEEMTRIVEQKIALEKPRTLLFYEQHVKGRKLGELTDPLAKAHWIRAFDEAHNYRQTRASTPEGGFADSWYSTVKWQVFGAVAKAVQVVEDGSIPNISKQLGQEHKVRNFYNNIFDPSEGKSVTIDTHAVAAAWLLPLGGNAAEVLESMGRAAKDTDSVSIGNAESGLSGTYVLYAEAYRRAAAEMGVLPREMQSITWEAIRGLFSPQHRAAHAKGYNRGVSDIWNGYAAGKGSIDAARKAVAKAGGGISEPVWFGLDPSLHEGAPGSTYTGELRGPGGALVALDRGRGGVLAQGEPTGLAGDLTDATLDNIVGVHFSYEPRTTLESKFAKLDDDNAESRRLRLATDERIKKRLNFYVDRGTGVHPELKVGPHSHLVTLRNIYDADLDPLGLFKNARVDADYNDAESGVIDAGFDGYLRRDAFSNQGAVVLLGDRSVQAQHLGGEADTKGKTVVPPPPKFTNRQLLSHALLASNKLISGSQSVEGWAKDLKRHHPELWPEIEASGVLGSLKGSVYRDEIARALYMSQSQVLGQSFAPRVSFEDLGKVLKNPSGAKMRALVNRSADQGLRGVFDEDGNLHVWDAYNATHDQGAAALGIPYDYSRRVNIRALYDGVRVDADRQLSEEIRRRFKSDSQVYVIAAGAGELSGPEFAGGDYVLSQASTPLTMGGPFFARAREARKAMPLDKAKKALEKAGIYGKITPGRAARAEAVIGRIPPELRDWRYAEEYKQSWYFSQLSRMVDGAKQGAMPAGQWEKWIQGNAAKFAVKREEIDLTGVFDYLELRGDEKVTREELVAYLNANTLELKEVVHGAEKTDARIAAIAEAIDLSGMNPQEREDALQRLDDAEWELRTKGDDFKMLEMADDFGVDLGAVREGGSSPKFSEYVPPGGVPGSYREVLVTLPVSVEKRGPGDYVARDRFGAALGETEAAAVERLGAFKSSHWDESNVLVHLRLQTVKGADGKLYTQVFEIQSDWGQRGKKEGFAGDLRIVGYAWDDGKMDWIRVPDQHAEQFGAENIDASRDALYPTREEALKNLSRIGIPVAPFVTNTKSWVALGIKRALVEAAKAGTNGIVFATGQQNADLYDLSKQVSSISYMKRADGTYHVVAGRLDREGDVELGSNNTEQDLEEKVGKDIARKIINGEGEFSGGDMTTLRGVDLKVGGEGMRAFYDEIVPQVANDVLRKLGGGKVGTVEVRPSDVGDVYDGKKKIESGVSRKAFEQDYGFPYQFVPNGETQQLPGFQFTPELKKTILQGLPLFQTARDRGQIAFGPDITKQPSLITLLKYANLSTFLHETGHFAFEVYRVLATEMQGRTDLTAEEQSLLDDTRALIEFAAGVDLDTWNAMTFEQRREGHEKVARAFEAYLFKGKAPSLRLQPLFRRFKAWLTAVYKQLTALNVELTPEVTQVFDRMVATEAEIQQAVAARGLAPMFKTRPEGMTEEEWAEYQTLGALASGDAEERLLARRLRDMRWLSNAKSRLMAEMQKKAAERRKAMRREVEQELNNEPERIAERFLKYGEIYGPDGEEIKALQGSKLSIGALEEMYPEGALEELPAWRRLGYGKYGMLAKEGLHPDDVAAFTGFSSGDALVRALLELEPRREIIEARVDQRMLERYGDLADPRAMENAVDEALGDEAHGKFIATELAALNAAIGKPRLMTMAAKEYAEEVVSRQRVRDIKPAQYKAAEARASKASLAALSKGDQQTAAVEKRNQLVNFYLAKAAAEALERQEKGLAYLKKFNSKTIHKRVDPSYLDQIHQLLEKFDLRPASLREIDRRTSLVEWAADQEAQGFQPVVPEYLLNEARRTHFKNLSIAEWQGLLDTVRNIEHLGRLKSKLLTAKDAREFAAIVKAMETSIRDHANRTTKKRLESNTAMDALREKRQEFFAMHRKLASWANEMDGGADGGTIWDFLIRPMNEAGAKEAVMREQATVKLMQLLKPVLDKGGLKKKRLIPEINDSLSYEGRLMVALNWGNEGNRQRLMDGDGWNPDQVMAILKTLTAEDLAVVQAVWDYLDTFRPEIGAQQKRMTGLEPKWVDAAPFTVELPSGPVEMRGGYLPAKYDTKRSLKASQQEAATGLMEQWRGARGYPKTRDSFTKERAAKVIERPLRKDLGVLFQHLTDVTHRLAWQDWVFDANRLLNAKPLVSAIEDHYGLHVVKAMREAVQDIAAGELPAQNAMEDLTNHLRSGATIVGMGWNLFVTALQPLGLTQSMARIGPKWVAKGLMSWIGSPQHMTDVAEWIYERSPTMRLRGKTFHRDISEIRNVIKNSGDFSIFDPLPVEVQESYFWLIAKAQQMADIPTWIGAYEKAIGTGETEERAAALADQAVLDSQGGGQLKDLAAIQRGGPLLKLFTAFYSYFSATYNLVAQKTRTTNLRNPGEVGRLAVDYMLLLILPSVLNTMLREALRDDCGDDMECLAHRLGQDQMTYLMGTMVGLRELSAMFSKFDYTGPAGLRGYSEIAKLGKQISQGEMDAAFWRALNSTAGVVFHYPAGQVQKTVEGAIYMNEEETANPLPLLFGKPVESK